MTDGRLNVVVIDDFALIRERLAAMLSEELGARVVGEAADGVEGLNLIRRTRPDVAILDLRMPRLDGFGVLTELAAQEQAPQVIVITSYPLAHYQDRCTSLGAYAVLDKSRDLHKLPDLLREIAAA
jgi:DNA-binding NarL/FixJ family response regulator